MLYLWTLGSHRLRALSPAQPLIQEALPPSLRLRFLTSKNSSGGMLTFLGCCFGSQGQERLLLKGSPCLLSYAYHGDGSHGRRRGQGVEGWAAGPR